MPELPEVEIVARNLTDILKPPFRIQEWMFFRKDLRFPIPIKKLGPIRIQKISRRAKYLIFESEDEVIISHLGMTGAWRVENEKWQRRKHDHLAFRFQPKKFLVYEDARRFGFVEVCKKTDFTQRFQYVGVEPLDPAFDEEKIYQQFKKLNAPIKNALMNQKLVVGIGNIYASEILFRTQISPLKKCLKISHAEYARIWAYARAILNLAIEGGGSTIDNYKNSFGQSGSFQNQHHVYGRDGEKCHVCAKLIKAKILAGRNTFWCPSCQK